MKTALKMDVAELVSALKMSVAERKTTIPILNYAKVGNGEVVTTNLDLSVTTKIPSMTGEGIVMLPVRQCLDVLAGESGELAITLPPVEAKKSSCASLTNADCEYSFESLPASNFPTLPKIPEAAFTIPGKEFRTLIKRTIFAATTEESHHTINGALLEVEAAASACLRKIVSS